MNATVQGTQAPETDFAPSVGEICTSLDAAPIAAHQQPAQSPAGIKVIKPLGTLSEEYVSKYLTWIAEDQRHAHLLKQMHDKRTDGQARDAIWSGYWALKGQAERFIQDLRDMGGLLYVGQAPAIETARRIVRGGAA